MSSVAVCSCPSATLCPYRCETDEGKVMCARLDGEPCPASLADVLVCAADRKEGGMSGTMYGYDAPAVLKRAAQLLQERGQQYDAQDGATPAGRERSMARVVAAFNALHGTNLTTAQGLSFMLLLKLVRLFCAPGFHEDSADDAVAYAALLAEGKAGESGA